MKNYTFVFLHHSYCLNIAKNKIDAAKKSFSTFIYFYKKKTNSKRYVEDKVEFSYSGRC